MDNGKLVPIVIAIVLLLVAGYLFRSNQTKKTKTEDFSKIVVDYNGQKEEFKDLNVDAVFKLNNINFWVVSVDVDKVVLNTTDNLKFNDKETNEFSLNYKKENKICFNDSSCATLTLS